jgi:hypothetical protein
MRTIWVAVRGINYTDQATRQVGRNIDALVRKQQELQAQAVKMLMAGAMWTVFAGLAVVAITKIMEKSAEGRRVLFQFERSMNGMLKTVGDGFARVLGPAIKVLSAFFDVIAKYPILGNLIALLTTLLITYLALKGITMIITGLSTYLGVSHLFQAQATKQLTLAQFGCVSSSTALAFSFKGLVASLGPAFLIFMAVYQVFSMIGNNIPLLIAGVAAITVAFIALAYVLWSSATAMSIITFGAAAAIGVGAAIAASLTAPTYQTGVHSVRKTQLAVVHEGEEIRSKRNVMYGQGTTGQRPETRLFNFTFSGDIRTKADKEELKPLILKTVREAMDNKV